VRAFRALHVSTRRYCILYELRDPAVVGSSDYLARLNAPTPWSQRIMPQLQNFARGGGRKVAEFGTGCGGYIAALRSDAPISAELQARAAELATMDRLAAVRMYETDLAQTSIRTNEKGMRAGDGSFASLVLVESLDEAALSDACAALGQPPPTTTQSVAVPTYVSVFALDRRMLTEGTS
jgi:hypothetical protein